VIDRAVTVLGLAGARPALVSHPGNQGWQPTVATVSEEDLV
jgi:hypothetical protein